MRILLSASILVTAMLTPAYAALPQQAFIAIKPLKVESLSSIHSIGLLEVPEMGSYALRKGDIGLEIFVGDYAGDTLRPLEYDKNTRGYSGYNFSEIAMESLTNELQPAAYQVVQFPADRNNKNRFLERYNGFNAQAVDAYLDVVPRITGYYRPDRAMKDGVIYDDPPFYLQVSFDVQLISAMTQQILYRDRVTCLSLTTASSEEITSSGTVVYAIEDHQFVYPQDLKKNAEIALDQLARRIETVMQEIARKISKSR